MMLAQGSSGDRVRQLQEMLNVHMALPMAPLAVDGLFGPKTRARVVDFQKKYFLTADGIVGPITGAALFGKVWADLTKK
jgi:peptidoglycan hydrolase-like protein with peptidoglycan-binding domain